MARALALLLGMARASTRAVLVGLLCCFLGCVLPEFHKVEGSDEMSAKAADPDTQQRCDVDLPVGGACRKCIAEKCCAHAMACAKGACGEDIQLPITPLTEVTERFDALARCMLQECDTEESCDVRWGCVDNYSWPTLQESHLFAMRTFHFADPDERGMPDIAVRLCESSDPQCADPGGHTATAITDARGNVAFTAPRGFTGFFLLDGGAPTPATVQWSQPVYNVVNSFSHQALTQASIGALAMSAGLHATVDEALARNRGFLLLRMQNCLPLRYLDRQDATLSGRASDVQYSFTPNAGASRVYYANDMAMIDQALEQTRSRGYAGAFEVAVTNITVTATHAATGRELATGTLPIRPGTVGYLYLVPSTAR